MEYFGIFVYATIFNSILSLFVMGTYYAMSRLLPNWCVRIENTFSTGVKIAILHFGFWILWLFPSHPSSGVGFIILLVMPFFALVFSSQEKFNQLKKLVVPVAVNVVYITFFLGIFVYFGSQF